ncbi:MAG: peptidylprolyl isomerase [Patescibacteria group bacterium]|nr:peptidylprolyl isomerase [Patescibacteria group bacterium]
MRKEIIKIFKVKKSKKKLLWALLGIILFVVINGFFVYYSNPNNYYFFLTKKIIPYPALIVGNRIVTFLSLDDKIAENKKIYEIAYKVNFASGSEGKKNYDVLKDKTKNESINEIIMENLLKSEKEEITDADVKKEYENIVKSTGNDKEIVNILKYSAGIDANDIKDKIYQNLLTEKVKNNFLYNLKMKAILITVEDPNKKEDWEKALQRSNDIYNEIRDGKSSFDQNYALYGNKNDGVVQNFGKDIYFKEDLPDEIQSVFYNLQSSQINEPIKTANGYYIFNVYERRGYFKGSYDDFMKEQRKQIRIVSFLH